MTYETQIYDNHVIKGMTRKLDDEIGTEYEINQDWDCPDSKSFLMIFDLTPSEIKKVEDLENQLIHDYHLNVGGQS